MSALAIAQDEHGWLPPEAMDGVAQQLGMPPVAVYEVASFYAMYNLKPTGRFKLTICTNLPCALQGAEAAAEHLKERLGIGFGETTGDGLFTLKEGECMGACGDAPVCSSTTSAWQLPESAADGRAARRVVAAADATAPHPRRSLRDERAVRIPRLRSRCRPDGRAHRPQLAPRRLREARRLRRAEEDPRREDYRRIRSSPK